MEVEGDCVEVLLLDGLPDGSVVGFGFPVVVAVGLSPDEVEGAGWGSVVDSITVWLDDSAGDAIVVVC